MRFSKLRLTGFKSFVDPTDLIISDGLTGVVGPNGCGKSNLLEALRWVMGENRPKAMRGGGMEDVIFAGAATRPARNFAEVSLIMDNTERLAPAGFNDADSLEIVRRITRDVGSAFKTNGKDVRARDVQMLFADASTGAHSPALVRQGQISELINAKPKARRRILEEAAGISGLYQRRHEAELKLKGTEANLARIEDLIGQLAAQLAQLARQARQAARYREIGADLREAEGQQLYRRWAEAEASRVEAETALRARVTAAAQAERAVSEASRARAEAEAALPPLREEEAIAAALVQRLAVERTGLDEEETRAGEAIATLTKRIGQLSHDITREAGLNKDAGETIARLEWEAAEIEKASEGFDDALAEATAEATYAAQILQEREADLAQRTEDAARLSARHQSAQRLVEECRAAQTRAESEATKASEAMDAAKTALAAAGTVMYTQRKAEAEAEELAARAEAALTGAEEARADAQSRESTARAARSEAAGELSALRAESGALAKLVAREAAEDGQLLDRLTVTPGYEKALGAALGDDLKAPVVTEDGPSGWASLPGFSEIAALPAGVEPLSLHVKAPEVLGRRMDQIGVIRAEDAPRLQPLLRPGQRLVSREGDLWRWDGLRNWAEDAPSTAALRLEQLNRLEALKQSLEEATARADGAERAHEALKSRLEELTRADAEARAARREADRQQAEAARALSRAEADRTMAEGRLENLTLSLTRHRDEALAASSRRSEAEAALKGLEDLDEARGAVEDLRLVVEAARITMLSRRSAQDELRRTGTARTKRAQEITKEVSGWKHRLATAEARSAELTDRKSQTEAELAEAEGLPGHIAERRGVLLQELAKAESRKAAARDALAGGEAALRQATEHEREAERNASEAREDRARVEARLDAAREAVGAAAERIAEAHQVTPNQLLGTLALSADDIPPIEALEAEISRLKRQRDALGAVNLRAEEDAAAVQTEHDALLAEKTDLEEAVTTLRSGIAGLNREGRERLLTAFEQVNGNFSMLFKHLFGGGEANLVMVESDDPLEAGLEIMCQPPGKKLSTLSLLSGGEQTLTALALIFAVFLANPAPICVLDEVDAPLDDANVTRFCDLLDEMCRQTETRFLIITHHAVTMARMDRLFGVTMAEQGVSQLVSVDLKKAETLVA